MVDFFVTVKKDSPSVTRIATEPDFVVDKAIVTVVVDPRVVGGILARRVVNVKLGPPGAVLVNVARHWRGANGLVVLVVCVVPVRPVNKVPGPLLDALSPQTAHEELEADECEDCETEEGEDHHVLQRLDGFNQRADDGLQAGNNRNCFQCS